MMRRAVRRALTNLQISHHMCSSRSLPLHLVASKAKREPGSRKRPSRGCPRNCKRLAAANRGHWCANAPGRPGPNKNRQDRNCGWCHRRRVQAQRPYRRRNDQITIPDSPSAFACSLARSPGSGRGSSLFWQSRPSAGDQETGSAGGSRYSPRHAVLGLRFRSDCIRWVYQSSEEK